MFNLGEKMQVLIISALVALLLLAGGVVVGNFFNQDAMSNNVAVTVKAKEDLKDAVEKNNQAQEEIIKLKAEIEERKKVEQEVKVVEEENNKLTDIATENIKTIDNTKIVYVEKKDDINKSKIIIDEIWNVYNKRRDNENNIVTDK